MKPIERIAQLRNISIDEAREYAYSIQRICVKPPSFAHIVEAIEVYESILIWMKQPHALRHILKLQLAIYASRLCGWTDNIAWTNIAVWIHTIAESSSGSAPKPKPLAPKTIETRQSIPAHTIQTPSDEQPLIRGIPVPGINYKEWYKHHSKEKKRYERSR